jgi:vacuolar-type H+-ATPase subunit D/Vma8
VAVDTLILIGIYKEVVSKLIQQKRIESIYLRKILIHLRLMKRRMNKLSYKIIYIRVVVHYSK